MTPRALYYGANREPPRKHYLQAGHVTALYEAGTLRYIRVAEVEVVRQIYVAVRDTNWGTVPAVISNESIRVLPDRFEISYDATHVEGGIDFRWEALISGSSQGTVEFRMDGQAYSTFLKNRIGFCVLHPVRECAGCECIVEHGAEGLERTVFPACISSKRPFQRVTAIRHRPAAGLLAEVRFAGDLFETEDQRNWTDTSYKTFCTPLSLPFPAEIRKGVAVRQSVQIAITTGVRSEAAMPTQATLTIGEASFQGLPAIGLGCASDGVALDPRETELLRILRLSHLRVDLRMRAHGWRESLTKAAKEARGIGAALECAVFVSDAAVDELADLRSEIIRLRPSVASWLIFHEAEKTTHSRWVALARTHLGGLEPDAPIGGGTNCDYYEFNHYGPPSGASDVVCYSINPQVHAFDNDSLSDTLETQGATVENARLVAGGLPIAVSPVTLRPRFSASATGQEKPPAPDEVPPQVDRRQMSLFAAAWLTGSLASLCAAAPVSLTYFETAGWRGVIDRTSGSPLPELFHSMPGCVFPVYHVLAALADFRDGVFVPCQSSDRPTFAAMAFAAFGRVRTLVANLRAERQIITVNGIRGRAMCLALDETNAQEAMQRPDVFRRHPPEELAVSKGSARIELRPYAVARIDMGE